MKIYVIFIAALLFSTLSPAAAECSDTEHGWNEAGIHIGIQSGSKSEFFHLYEAFAVYELPWHWHPSSEWKIAPQLNTSLGVLHTAANTGVIGTIGTGLTLETTMINLVPEVGISASLMDKRYFARQDFGSNLLFGAYLGVSYRFDCGLAVGYRLLHLSNGHIFYPENTPNPGVDLHVLSASWRF